VSERAREEAQEIWVLYGKENPPKFRLFKSHQSWVRAAIEPKALASYWTGVSIDSGELKGDE
jgi:hypothetical protein